MPTPFLQIYKLAETSDMAQRSTILECLEIYLSNIIKINTYNEIYIYEFIKYNFPSRLQLWKPAGGGGNFMFCSKQVESA